MDRLASGGMALPIHILKTRSRLPAWMIVLLLVSGLVIRLRIATLGNNFDLTCWSMAGDLARQHQNVYAVDPYYNYGPVWLGIATALRSFQHLTGFYSPNSFHLLVTGVLALVDAAVCLMLTGRYGQLTGMFFYLNPVMLLLTGYHSQVDTLAISFALGSWLLLEPRDGQKISPARLTSSAGLMGLSLASKHIFLLFPIWVVMIPAVGSLFRRIYFLVISYCVPVMSLIPFCLSAAGRKGVVEHVIQYHGIVNNSLFTLACNLLIPYRIIEANLHGNFDPMPVLLQGIFFAVLIAAGWYCRSTVRNVFVTYLLMAAVFSPSMADQYLAIPIVACAIGHRHWAGWVYSIAATLVLLISPFDISESSAFPLLHQFAITARPIAVEQHDAGNDTALWMKAAPPPIGYPTAQIWLIPLLYSQMRRGKIATDA